MIKIWLLITMLSVQGWPSVKTTSEVWFSEEECQMKRVKNERELEKAALQYKPYLISTYAFELAQQFSEFYEKCKVINAKDEESKLALVKAFTIVLEKALYLLGIEVPDKM